ncbi:MAG: response regulator transcription factor [Chloroflexi bacterium]|nr:response regulator transcription factor [Chloroflexota bacterium]
MVIVDDHPLLRRGLQAALHEEPGVAVVGVTGAGATAIRLVEEHRPDVLLLDVGLPDTSGIDVARRVGMAFPHVAVLILTDHADVGFSRALLDLGVQGVLAKDLPEEAVVAAVFRAARGWTIAVPESMGHHHDVVVDLTVRQREVLQLLVDGQTNAEIARTLNISEKTVEYHLARVYAALGVRTRYAAARAARQAGLVRSVWLEMSPELATVPSGTSLSAVQLMRR